MSEAARAKQPMESGYTIRAIFAFTESSSKVRKVIRLDGLGSHRSSSRQFAQAPRTRISGWVTIRVLCMVELGALLRATYISALVLDTTSLILNPRETSSTTDGTTWGNRAGQYISQGCLRIMRHFSPLWQKSHALRDTGFWMTDGGFCEDRIPRSLYPLPGQGSGLVPTNATNACCSLADALEAWIHLTNIGPP